MNRTTSEHPNLPLPSYTERADRTTALDFDETDYREMYQKSIEEPERFWSEQAERFLTWFKPWTTVYRGDFKNAENHWFEGAELNVAYNCVDRHLQQKADQIAIHWEGDEPHQSRSLTYRELHETVCRLANALKSRGIRKGDRVSIYLPMIPEAAIAMLACARIGAVHSVIFAGFSADAIKDRILDAGSRLIVTADESRRGGRSIALKTNIDQALESCPGVESVIVVRHSGNPVPWNPQRDLDYAEEVAKASPDCPPAAMQAEDPLFILYTSGSTGKPKGVLHSTGGYLLYAAMTHRYVFDYREGDIYWCTADVGWITGHSYLVYGPLCNGATTLIYEGLPTYPDTTRYWRIVEKYRVNSFYTAPTVIRSLMSQGDAAVQSHSRNSLRILGSVGEPINPEAWAWYHRVVGEARCPIVDTWWQTESGGILITPLPGTSGLKPGSAMRPFFGVEPALLDDQGEEIQGAGSGNLVLKRSWPGQMRGLFGDPERFKENYFDRFPGYYFSGDGAHRDADGDYWITGRVDDVINVSGHRLGTAEIESALVLHPTVAEAAVVGFPHPLKGQGIYAYITLMDGVNPSKELEKELAGFVRKEIGPIAILDEIQWSPHLPKTRSGKIVRRLLPKIAADDLDNLGDTSTLGDPMIVDQLIESRHFK